MKVVYTDGGRAATGYRGSAGDCVTRAVAIATEQDYETVYRAFAAGTALERRTARSSRTRGRRTAREGIATSRKWFRDYMTALGWRWTPTMGIGTGCRVHLADGELPMGRLIVAVSKHYTAVIDGVIHDTHDPQRSGTMWFGHDGRVSRIGGGRCVYGYWSQA